MSFKIGQKVIWIEANIDPTKSKISSGIVIKIPNRDTVKLEREEFPRYSAFLYPDTFETHNHLIKQMNLAIKHKQEENEFMKQTYELNNQLIRDGLK